MDTKIILFYQTKEKIIAQKDKIFFICKNGIPFPIIAYLTFHNITTLWFILHNVTQATAVNNEE